MTQEKDDLEVHLNACLDWIHSGQETLESALAYFPEEASELRPLLETALWMQSQARLFDADPQRMRASKRRLVSKIKQEQAARQSTGWRHRIGSLFRPPTWAMRTALALLLVLALAFGSIGVAQASQSTIPGDALYGVKRSLEQAELAFNFSPTQDARLHIRYIGRRAVEIQNLMLENRLEYIGQAVAHYQSEVDKALKSIQESAKVLPAQSAQLASELQDTLKTQSPLFSVLAATAPAAYRTDLAHLQAVADEAISAANDVITLTETSPEVSLTQAPSATPTPGPTGVPDVNLSSTPTLAATNLPFILPTEQLSTAPSSTPSPTATAISEDEDGDQEVILPTKKPTKTPKPTKVPKPTKTPKIK